MKKQLFLGLVLLSVGNMFARSWNVVKVNLTGKAQKRMVECYATAKAGNTWGVQVNNLAQGTSVTDGVITGEPIVIASKQPIKHVFCSTMKSNGEVNTTNPEKIDLSSPSADGYYDFSG